MILLNCLIIISCDGNNLTSGDQKDNYPLVIYPLDNTTLEDLKQICDSLSQDKYDLNINQYGYCDYSGLYHRGISTIKSVDSAITLAKESILKFSQFTKVTDSNQLVVEHISSPDDGTPIIKDWIIRFDNQKEKQITVANTEIDVLITDDIIQIKGHHYENLHSAENHISRETAIESATGSQLVYSGYTGIDTMIVEQEMLVNLSLVLYPVQNDSTISIYTCWRMPVYWGSERPAFYIYWDAIRDVMLNYKPLIIG